MTVWPKRTSSDCKCWYDSGSAHAHCLLFPLTVCCTVCDALCGVQIRSIQTSGSDPARHIVVLISPHTSSADRQVLLDLGCRLREVEDLPAPEWLTEQQRWKYQLL